MRSRRGNRILKANFLIGVSLAVSCRAADAQTCLGWLKGLMFRSASEPNRTEPNRTEPNRTEPNRTEPTRLSESNEAIVETPGPPIEVVPEGPPPVSGLSEADLHVVLNTYTELLDRLPGGSDPAVLGRITRANDPFLAGEKSEVTSSLRSKLKVFSEMLHAKGWESESLKSRLAWLVGERLRRLSRAEKESRRAIQKSRLAYDVELPPNSPTDLSVSGSRLYAWTESAPGIVDLFVHDWEEAVSTNIKVKLPSGPVAAGLVPAQKGFALFANESGEIYRADLNGPGTVAAEPVTLNGPPFPKNYRLVKYRLSLDGDFAVFQLRGAQATANSWWMIDLKKMTRSQIAIAALTKESTENWELKPGSSPQIQVPARGPGESGFHLYSLDGGGRTTAPASFVNTPEGRKPFWSADGAHHGYQRFEILKHSAWNEFIWHPFEQTGDTGGKGRKLGDAKSVAMHPEAPQFAVLRVPRGLVLDQYVDWMGENGLIERVLVANDGEVPFDTISLSPDGTRMFLRNSERLRSFPTQR